MARRILCSSDAFGYGPTSILIASLRGLEAHAELTFVGSGIALEMAEREGIMECIRCLPHSYEEVIGSLQPSIDFVISSLNFEVSDIGVRLGLPTVLIDSLGWMWKAPVHHRGLTRYFVVNFPGLQEKLCASDVGNGSNVEVVGAVFDDALAPQREPGSQVLVNLGGMSSRLMPPWVQRLYASAVIEVLRGMPELSDRRVRIVGGKRALSLVEEANPPANFRLASLEQRDYLRELLQSERLLTAAGMNATFEAFHYGVPASFLPPQNMSQELTIGVLAEEGLSPFATNWAMAASAPDIREMDESSGCAVMNEKIAEFGSCFELRAAVESGIQAFLRADVEDLRMRQSAFLRSLGGSGAARIQAYIHNLLRDEDRRS